MEFNIATLMESIADVIPDNEAVVSGDVRLTYKQLDERANRFAHVLKGQGIGPGDHVGLYLFNGNEFLEAMLGTLKVRAVPININYRYVEDELLYLFNDADLKSLVFQREYAGRVAAIAGGIPTLRQYIYVDDESGANIPGMGTPGVEAVEFEAALASVTDARDFTERSGDDIFIVYTGGTTGMPKGVMWRHEDLFYAGLQGGNPGGEHHEKAEDLGARVASGDSLSLTFLPAAPFIHGAAQWTAIIGWFGAGKIVVVPGPSFDPPRVLSAIEKEGVNTITLVGDAMARPFADEVRRGNYDTSSLMVIVSAGAILSDSVRDEIQELLPEAMILNNFGATETGHQGASFEKSPDGRPTFAMHEGNVVIDEDHNPIEPGSGKVGFLARKGRLPVGYYKDPVKTAKTFFEIKGERWVVTGDMALVEEDGQITIKGRGAVCINTGGEKVFPEEVEEGLKAHPAVMDAVVVGVPDEKWGQRVAAIVQAREGMELDQDALLAFCRKKLAGYKVPREYFCVDTVVRHPSGKPDYRWAKNLAGGEQTV